MTRGAAVGTACLFGVLSGLGCHQSQPVMQTLPPEVPAVSQELIARPVPRPPEVITTSLVTAPVDTAAEMRVQIDTQGKDVDVRTVLTWLGDAAGIRFVFSPDINKKIRITLVDVPLSQAISTVLSLASLTLERTTTPARPAIPSVVFYTLPVNVDSLPVDAIMKRFGVSREVAEVLVAGRARKP